METLQQGEVRVPLGGDRVYKDQCVFSFDSPESVDGLYVCLYTFLGFGKEHVLLYHKKTGRRLFLHIKRTKKEQRPDQDDKEVAEVKKPTKLALGVAGGFDGGQVKEEFEETHSLVILPEHDIISLPNSELPAKVQESIAGITAAENVSKKEAILAWDGEKRPISKHASSLKQLNNGVKIPPSGWQCSRCDLTTNLWLNLTNGAILCGRRYFDGSGGNNHALEHFQQTHYPLCVKLGTITPDGADVFSYDEDTMVEDPNLAQHLAHFGINVALMTKTDQTMTELEIDMNMKIGEWSVIQESGKELELVYGPGYTGLSNLGNSCYLNSVMQVLFTVPEFQLRYYNVADSVFQSMPSTPTDDFEVQMCKLAVGLLSGKYSQQPQVVAMETDTQDSPKQKEQPGIAPYMFKAVVGRGHQEFGSSRQQDAQEFYLHLMTLIERHQRNVSNPVDSFKFKLEERVQCSTSGQVKYTTQETCLLSLPVPLVAATNKDEAEAWNIKRRQLEEKKERVNPDDIVRAKVPFTACLAALTSPVQIEDFYSTAINAKCTAIKTTRFATFPDYLMIQLNKFTIGDDWVPRKLDVLVDVPEQLMIEELRGRGLQSGEVELPDDTRAQPAVNIDESVVTQLVGMGFPLEGCRRAAYHTDGRGVEAAMEWALQHSADPDFAAPFTVTKDVSKASCDEGSINMIESMGFTRSQAVAALQATSNNLERAVDWIFSHADEVSAMETEQPNDKVKFKDGTGKYQLMAFISHMGTSTMCGHYVCHIKKDGRWVIFNDNKVALSVDPPIQLGYLYLYKRLI